MAAGQHLERGSTLDRLLLGFPFLALASESIEELAVPEYRVLELGVELGVSLHASERRRRCASASDNFADILSGLVREPIRERTN